MENAAPEFDKVVAIAKDADWPGVTEGLSWGTRALKVRDKMLVRWREPDVIVLYCDPDEKEILKQALPEVYFETDHYRGSSYLLARISAIDPDDLRTRLERRWRELATKKMVADYDLRASTSRP